VRTRALAVAGLLALGCSPADTGRGEPSADFATPAIYEADGRPFVAIAAGGGKLRQASGSRYIAFRLAP